jgi:hypothetical protein
MSYAFDLATRSALDDVDTRNDGLAPLPVDYDHDMVVLAQVSASVVMHHSHNLLIHPYCRQSGLAETFHDSGSPGHCHIFSADQAGHARIASGNRGIAGAWSGGISVQ